MLNPLPLKDWHETKTALHLFIQIVGKIRLQFHPQKNHWWHATFYLTTCGLTTGPIPHPNGFDIFQIEFNLIKHQLIIKCSDGKERGFNLKNLAVADFDQQLLSVLPNLGIHAKIIDKPFDPERAGSSIPFSRDKEHKYRDLEHAHQFWQILNWTYSVFQRCNSFFFGKVTPLHFFWHSFDYVLTFFSGKPGPDVSNMDPVSRQAYSHEVISFGFWPGDNNLPEPAYYSYTYPEPKDLREKPLMPQCASWETVNNSAMALLKYHDLIKLKNPQTELLNFLKSAYGAGASSANWDQSLWKNI